MRVRVKTIGFALIMILTGTVARSSELTVDQQLIVACFDVNIKEVVICLRRGGDVHATLGKVPQNSDPFRDRWTGSTIAWSDSWTPLIALACAYDYPQPNPELGEIWKDEERALQLRDGIGKDRLNSRRADAITILQILLSHGARVDVKDVVGATPLYLSADRNKLEIARLLLEFGADPNTKTGVYIDGPSDRTPLHVASDSMEMTELLLRHGADGSAKDSNGRTPAQWVELHDDRRFDLVKTPAGWRVIRRRTE